MAFKSGYKSYSEVVAEQMKDEEKNILTLPYKYVPRPYQVGLFNCLANGYKRVVAVWNRRSGKTKTLLNLMVKESWMKVGTYYYLFPTYSQGRRVLWDGTDLAGMRFLDHIPERIRESTNNTEMKIRLVNGSLIQVIGSDNVKDTIVGTNPLGCIFDEYGVEDPSGFEYIRPALVENKGWAIFIGTPRGYNHFNEQYEIAKRQPENWFCELLTNNETHSYTEAEIEQERKDGMSEDLIQQEIFCS